MDHHPDYPVPELGEMCPYSDPPYGQFTDDHVFPEFLGGRKTIRVCKDCNDKFGHSFEGNSSKQLKRLQVFVSHFGLDLSRNAATWPSAIEIDGILYDLKSGPDGTQYELSRPLIRRDEAGRIIGGTARSRAEAEQVAASLLRKGKAKEVGIEESRGTDLRDVKLCVDLSYNEDLYRFSAKLVGNMTVLMGRARDLKCSGIAEFLHGGIERLARIAVCDTSPIRALRPGLSHTVYIEFSPLLSQAIVILFGAMQLYVPLPCGEKGAYLGFLDPVSGEESFQEVKFLGITPAPTLYTEADARAQINYTNRELAKEARARGAKRPPDLTVTSVDLGAPTLKWQVI